MVSFNSGAIACRGGRLLLLAAAFFFQSRGFAQDRPPSDSLPKYELGEILVIGTRQQPSRAFQTEIPRAPIASAATPTVSALLARSPGAVVTTGTKGVAQLSVRGMPATATTVLLDGHPINTPYYGDVDLNSIPLRGLSRIQIMKGPAASAYGANTLGGVVNMVTGSVEPGMTVQDYRLAFGPDGRRDAAAGFGIGYGRFSLWGSTGYAEADAVPLSSGFRTNRLEGGSDRNNSDYRHLNLDAKVTYMVSDAATLTLGAGRYDAERGAPPTTDTTVAPNRVTYDRFPEWTRDYINLNGSGHFGRRVAWRSTAYYDNQTDRLIRYADDSYNYERIKFDSRHESQDWGTRTEATTIVRRHVEATIGTTWRRDAIDRRENVDEPTIYNTADTWSVFNQWNLKVWQAVTLDAGLSLNGMRSAGANARAHSLHPHLAVSVATGPRLTVNGAVARATRFPTLHHFYSATSGNPDLQPERANKYEVGGRWTVHPRAEVTGSVFWNDVNGLIDRASKVDTFHNVDKVRIRGVEAGGEWKTEDVSLGLTVGYIDAQATISPSGQNSRDEFRRPWVPRVKLDYNASVALPADFKVDHSGHLVSDRVDAGGGRMADYYTAQIRLSRVLYGGVTVFVDAQNILDANYETETGYPEPGRTVLFGIEMRNQRSRQR